MSQHPFNTVSLYAYLEEDSGADDDHPRPESVDAGAGHVVVGAEVDGVKVPLIRVKAGKFLQRLQAHKLASAEAQAATPAAPAGE